VAAPAEGGRANEAVIGLVAATLEVPRNSVRIVSGRTSRRKVVEVDGLEEEEAGRRLEAAARR
jgi:uncharacterized protein YggU (UPF0235/DUF167 family)